MKRVKLTKGLKDKRGIVIISGYFNPLHIGHLNLIREAKRMGKVLIVIVNSDEQVKLKGSVPFMSEGERMAIVGNLKDVDQVVKAIDADETVCHTLREIYDSIDLIRGYYNCSDEVIFANGGDRKKGNTPERSVCDTLGITMKWGVGGRKAQSSSKLIKNVKTKNTENN